jgi:dihydroorotate dehydrogenase (fumarate)
VPLATNYLGLALKNPIVATASSLDSKLHSLRQLEDAGAAAIVLPPLFQEQIEAAAQAPFAGTSGTSLPRHYLLAAASRPYGVRPDHYLDLVRTAFDTVSIPVIASLNGASHAGWIEYARLFEQAGASALELDLYHIPTDLLESGRDIEARYTEIVGAVCSSVNLPVSVKLTPYLSSIGNFAATLVEQGAAGLVLFNRPLRVDVDILRMSLTDTLEMRDPAEMPLPILWTALLSGRLHASIAAHTDIYTATDVVKCLLAGADVVMTTSDCLQNDVGYIATLIAGLHSWLGQLGIESVAEMRGMLSWHRSRNHHVYTRANYLRILEQYVADARPI